MKKICKGCGKEFETKYPRKQLCGQCPPLYCKNCGKEMPFRLIRGVPQECCSMACHNALMTKKEGYVCGWSKESTKEKIKQTFQRKYGVNSVLDKNSPVWDKIKATNLEKYGTEIPVKNEVVKQHLSDVLRSRTTEEKALTHEKMIATFRQNLGVDWSSQSPQVIRKCLKTKRQRYGEHLEVLTNRQKQKMLEKYGVEKIEQLHLPEELKAMLFDKEKSIKFLERGWTLSELFEYFDNCRQGVRSWIQRLDLKSYIKFQKSSFEFEVGKYLPGWKTTRQILRKDGKYKEIDLYSDVLKIGIECDGLYWHSDLNIDKYYHYNKSKLAEELGIHLVHIYEWEWNDLRIRPILISILNLFQHKIENRIYARNCKIYEISNKEAKVFNEKNHLQGHRNAQVTYGLFYNNQLVQLMSFSYDKKRGWWEIIRGCPGSNNLVVGGVSKLFNHFIKEHNPVKVFSYCDFNKFDGKGYEAIGMKCIGYTGPDKTWIINGHAVKRNPAKYSEYKKLSEAIIWGAGSKKYLWQSV